GIAVAVFPRPQRRVARGQAAALRAHARFRRRDGSRSAAFDAELVPARLTLLVRRDDDAVRPLLLEGELEPRVALRAVEVVVFLFFARGCDDHDVGIERGGDEIKDRALAGAALELVGIVVLAGRELGVTARQRTPVEPGTTLFAEHTRRAHQTQHDEPQRAPVHSVFPLSRPARPLVCAAVAAPSDPATARSPA